MKDKREVKSAEEFLSNIYDELDKACEKLADSEPEPLRGYINGEHFEIPQKKGVGNIFEVLKR